MNLLRLKFASDNCLLTNRLGLLQLPLLLLFGITSSDLIAQIESSKYEKIEEIVVTATKREQGIYDVPIALSAMQGDSLEERGIKDLVDVGKFVPNLTVTTFAAGHTSSANPFIRGIGTQDHLITTDPGVAVYVDGVYLGRQVGQHWNLSNIERVEVLRGPQGTLYGRNSIGGAINIVTAIPGQENLTSVRSQLGQLGRRDVGVFLDQRLNDSFAIAIQTDMRQRGGVGRFTHFPDSGIEVGEYRDIASRVDLVWRATDQFEARLALDTNQGRNGLNPYTTLIDEVPHGAIFGAGYRNSDISENPYDNDTGQESHLQTRNSARGIAVTAEWYPTDQISSRLIASSRRSDYSAGLDDDSFLDDFLRFPETGFANQQSFEFQLLGETGDISYVAGLYHFEEQGQNVQDPTVFLGNRGSFLLSQDTRSSAFFTNVKKKLSEAWTIGAGLRRSQDQKVALTNVGLGEVAETQSWSEISWDLAIQFALNERLRSYLSIQEGYRSGEFPARPYCLFADPACFRASGNVTAVNVEIGLKGQLSDLLEVSLAAFNTEYSDLPYQVSTTQGEGFSTVNLVVEQTTIGFEAESKWLITDSFQVHISAGLLSEDVAQQMGVKPVAPLTPGKTFAMGPQYERLVGTNLLLTLRTDLSHRGAMWGEPSSDQGRHTRINSRTIGNVYIGLSSVNEDWTAALYLHNFTDERYDNARINTGDYILRILSNDARELGLKVKLRW